MVEMHFSYKNHLLYSQAQIKQTMNIVMMTKEGSTKIVNFMTPGAAILVLRRGRQTKYKVRLTKNCKFHDPQGWDSDVRRGHISHYREYVLSPTPSIYSTLIAIVLRDHYDAAFRYHS